ncbi:recombinase family protein [Agromyces sp. GXS1127]|uniref:recombinase family protein n=1 Tax=Agromyces sp. GXS1127 TaxID=3424181 RepID=UPI003D3147A2
MTTAAIYTRISKDREGRELGVDRQENDCRALATRLGYDSVVIFRDNDVSASTLSQKLRPEFEDMMRRTRSGEFAALIAYSNSRLTRRVVELQAIVDVVRSRKVRIHTVVSGQHDLDTADGRAAMLTIAVFDQAEAERTAERIRRKQAEKRSNGEWHGGALPYGYTTKDGALVPVAAEVKVIKEAMKRVVAGDSMGSIARDFNERGLRTKKGNAWRQVNLRAILLNRSLIGETKAGVKGWDPVVDRMTFEKVTAILTDPARKSTQSPGVKGGKYSMGGGLTVCAICGCNLITHGKRGEVALACLKRVYPGKACGGVTIKHEALERYVFDRVFERLAVSPDWETELRKPQPADESKVAELDNELADLAAKRVRVQDGYEDGVYTRDEARERLDRLDGLKKVAEDTRSKLLGTSQIADTLADGMDWTKWPAMRRRTFLRFFIQRVEVGKWPAGHARSAFRRIGDTDEQHAERQRDRYAATLPERVNIIWS